MVKPTVWMAVWVVAAMLLVGCGDDTPRGVLEFRIAPYRPEVREANSVSFETRDEYVALLAAHGPEDVLARDGDYVWLPVRGYQRFPTCVTAEYEGRQFLLLDNRPGSVMLHDLSPDGWRIAKVSEGESHEGRPAVEFRLNSVGAEMMAEMTAAHQGDALAVIVYGEVCSVPIIRSEIPGQGLITTSDAEDAAEILRQLREGLPVTR